MSELDTESAAGASEDVVGASDDAADARRDAAEATKTVADATVVILAYSTERWALTCASIESVLNQTLLPRELILCIDHNPELLERLADRFHRTPGSVPSVRVVESRDDGDHSTPGAHEEEWQPYASHGERISSGRTTALDLAGTEVLAFIDDDATADADWLARLLEPFADASVLAVGGAPLPVYEEPRPRWFPAEFDWVFGCAYAGLPTTTAPVLRLIGANMAARRERLVEIGGFRSVAEDLDMCHRLLELSPQGKLIYEPRAVVHHYVNAERVTWHYFWRRCWANRNKVELMRSLGGAANLRADRRWTQRTLSVGVTTGLRDFLGGDIGGLQRALAIIAGVGIAGAAYATGLIEWKVASWRRRDSRSAS
jgi:glucosyl-dolichyl phosphate glucuronosyltransferase